MIFLSAIALASAPVPVDYYLSFENAAHREASIVATFAALPDEPLVVRMARSSPGRYALHEFAKNVDDVRATDSQGRELTIRREDPYRWIVEGHDGVVKFHYTLFADRADGTYSQVDTSHAHLNIPATLVWSEALVDRPVTVRMTPYSADWKVATQLEPTDHPYVYKAPDHAYLMDSPIELSDFDLREWEVSHKGETATIRLAVHHEGSEEALDEFENRTRAIVDAHIALWDDLPDYDYGTYTFIADYLPWASGDGMEHRNSTILSSSRGLEQAKFGQLGTVSHEFFHGWNVERLRPADLEPFDFTKADVSQHLWFAEGFTSYYDDLLRLRARDIDRDAFFEGLGFTVSATQSSPARPGSSPAEMSRNAPYLDAARSVDPDNFANSKLSYYTYGAAVGFGLDLELRARGSSLDDYMRLLWERFGRTATPYTDADLVTALADMSGDPQFARTFFETVVHGDALPDYGALLADYCYAIGPASPGQGTLGWFRLDHGQNGATITGNSLRGDAIYEAGLTRGDRILAVNGRKITSRKVWEAATGDLDEGQLVVIDWARRDGSTGRSRVKAKLGRMLAIKPSCDPDAAQTARRDDWLGAEE